MNWLDLTLIGVIATGTFFGIITGPLWQIYRISSVALSAAAAYLLRNLTGSILSGIFSSEISVATSSLTVRPSVHWIAMSCTWYQSPVIEF